MNPPITTISLNRFMFFATALLHTKHGYFTIIALRQGFIQTVLLISIFEKRLRFRILFFVKNDHKIILQ